MTSFAVVTETRTLTCPSCQQGRTVHQDFRVPITPEYRTDLGALRSRERAVSRGRRTATAEAQGMARSWTPDPMCRECIFTNGAAS